ncbi:uncharacterized protein LOC124991386 [Sciurus carolinensis]|uniref:uncharacterized protein LOC124991386 n=1 Tax=Sciurus carolinensis TaxID=30640 RepID=UPI001FB36417|nr:uncharacterized protein LOC124991386 [Sciurus carolinensis]
MVVPNTPPCNSPVQKTDGFWKMTDDYHKLNQVVTPTVTARSDGVSFLEHINTFSGIWYAVCYNSPPFLTPSSSSSAPVAAAAAAVAARGGRQPHPLATSPGSGGGCALFLTLKLLISNLEEDGSIGLLIERSNTNQWSNSFHPFGIIQETGFQPDRRPAAALCCDDISNPHRRRLARFLFYLTLTSLLLSIVGYLIVIEMGQTQSTPLTIMVSHFEEVQARARNLSVEISKRKLVTFCKSDWPTFQVGWPPEGTFHLPTIQKVKDKIFQSGKIGHPDQIPYILTWENLVDNNPPTWLSPFLPPPPSPTTKMLALKKLDSSEKPTAPHPILPEDDPDPLLVNPPPYMQAPIPPQDPGPEATEEREAATSENEEERTGSGGLARRTRSRAQRAAGPSRPEAPDSTVALPLRETGPPDNAGNPRLQYWPFSTSDLYNWKNQNAKFSDNPKDLISLLDSVMFTHQPTWDDCQQLLRILFTTEERERIQMEARKLVPGDDGQPTVNPDLINASFPLSRPPQDEWNYNTAEGKERLRVYRQTLMGGLRAAARKPTNLAKGRRGSEPLPEPRVTLKVEGTPVQFLVDTGAQYSALTDPQGKISTSTSWVQGATGIKKCPWTTKRTVDLGTGKVSHSFLVIPDSPYPLLGRDLLTKIGAQINFHPEGAQVTDGQGKLLPMLTLTLEEEYRLHQQPRSPDKNIEDWVRRFPDAWAETGGIGLAKHRPALYIEIKPGANPVRVKQYSMPREAQIGITPHIRRLLNQGVLRPCRSAWNTPLLPIRKPNSNEYRPVQDLREVNKRVADIHPTVPNPYTLLSALPPYRQWYTVLDLKDAFFSLPLAPKSQELFAFEWTDIDEGINGQLTWTRLPQGFKNSPTLFDEALHEDLGEFRQNHPNLTLLQYVDDLLIAAENWDECIQGTEDLLQTLGTLGYRASAKKAQICRPEVTYLGYLLREGKRWLTQARKETVLRIPKPQSPRQVREFLGSAGFCRLWIPGFAELAKPLYEATKDKQPFNWTIEADTAFQQIKDALLSAPALGLPDVVKPFFLYIDESKGIAKGVLTQYLGPWRRPIAYLSKKLDPVAAGWPPCLRMIAATALMVKDADKLTMGQELHVVTPHAIEGILKQPPDRWLSNARLTHYQGLLLNPLRIIFQAPSALNPATLLPDPDLDTPIHDCSEILAQVHGLREDLQDYPLLDADAVWFTDGSSFLHQGQRYAGAAVVTETEVIWAEPLPIGTSAQKAELIAMTKALMMGKDKKLTVYTDSRYAFATAHIHGAIYRERGMLTAEGKSIKNKEEIVSLIDALWLPKKLAIVHCPGHQKPSDPVSRGNCLADKVAREIALQRDLITDLSWIRQQPLAQCSDGWWKDSENRIILPELMGQKVLCRLHQTTHMGTRKLQDLMLQAGIKIKGVQNKIEQIVKSCRVCKLTNAGYSKGESGNRLRGDRPGAYWEVDFTEVKPGRYGYKYLLVFVDTFSGWVEAFPTKRETAQIVAKKILEDLLPRPCRGPTEKSGLSSKVCTSQARLLFLTTSTRVIGS